MRYVLVEVGSLVGVSQVFRLIYNLLYERLCLGIFLSSCLNILSVLFISMLLARTVFWKAHFLDGF